MSQQVDSSGRREDKNKYLEKKKPEESFEAGTQSPQGGGKQEKAKGTSPGPSQPGK